MEENDGMKTVLITGGSRGIGEAMVRLYVDQGWRVAFTYLTSDEKAQTLSRESGALALRCDAKAKRIRRPWRNK